MKPAWLLPLALAACVTPQVYVTSIGPLRVLPHSNLTIVAPQAPLGEATHDAIPEQGGLIVRTINGRPVPFEARLAALEALEAHCLDQAIPGVPLFFGWRDADGAAHWSAAGCA